MKKCTSKYAFEIKIEFIYFGPLSVIFELILKFGQKIKLYVSSSEQLMKTFTGLLDYPFRIQITMIIDGRFITKMRI